MRVFSIFPIDQLNAHAYEKDFQFAPDWGALIKVCFVALEVCNFDLDL
jgi:hypothetical protein